MVVSGFQGILMLVHGFVNDSQCKSRYNNHEVVVFAWVGDVLSKHDPDIDI